MEYRAVLKRRTLTNEKSTRSYPAGYISGCNVFMLGGSPYCTGGILKVGNGPVTIAPQYVKYSAWLYPPQVSKTYYIYVNSVGTLQVDQAVKIWDALNKYYKHPQQGWRWISDLETDSSGNIDIPANWDARYVKKSGDTMTGKLTVQDDIESTGDVSGVTGTFSGLLTSQGLTSTVTQVNITRSTTIGGTNLANAWLLLGTTSVGLGMDNNELYTKGLDLNLGCTDNNKVNIRTNNTTRVEIGQFTKGSYTTTMDIQQGIEVQHTGPWVLWKKTNASTNNGIFGAIVTSNETLEFFNLTDAYGVKGRILRLSHGYVGVVKPAVEIAKTSSNLLNVGENTDIVCYLGRVAIGYNGSTSDNAVFAHYDHMSLTGAGFRQTSTGTVVVNCPTGTSVLIRKNNVTVMEVGASSDADVQIAGDTGIEGTTYFESTGSTIQAPTDDTSAINTFTKTIADSSEYEVTGTTGTYLIIISSGAFSATYALSCGPGTNNVQLLSSVGGWNTSSSGSNFGVYYNGGTSRYVLRNDYGSSREFVVTRFMIES